MGDIEALASSIAEIGLLQPIGIDDDHNLIFGHRRLLAFKHLGRSTIPARVINIGSLLMAEHAENEFRKDFTISERVEIGRALEAEIGRRKGQRTDLRVPEKFPEVRGRDTRDVAAEKAGFGNGKTYEQAKKVLDHGAPELVAAVERGEVSVSAAASVADAPIEVQAEIVARGRDEILAAAKQIRTEQAERRRAELAEKKAEQPALPDGRFETIVIDPPWEMQKIERDVRPNQVAFDYPTMTEDELSRFDVASIAAEDCHLFCWTTHKHMPMALRLLEAWGFRYVCTMVWHKPGGFQPIGLPQYNCEFVLYGRRGSPQFADTKAFPACFQAPRREHSRKPDEFYDLIRRVTAGPRIDVFSREARDGFDQFGNEADKFNEAA